MAVFTSNDVANQALLLVSGANTPPVTGVAPNFDKSAAGLALQKLYAPCVQTVARQFGWDFARSTVALALSGNAAPFPWAFEYLYPSNGVEVWQLAPPALADPNNPLPVNFEVANAVVATGQARVIHANLANALGVYNNAPVEAAWDSLFREAVVRALASELGMAIFGKPDVAEMYLESGAAFETLGEGRMG